MPLVHAPLQQLGPFAQKKPFCVHPGVPLVLLLVPLPLAAGPPLLVELFDPPAPPPPLSVVPRQPAIAKRPVDTTTKMQMARIRQVYSGSTSRASSMLVTHAGARLWDPEEAGE